MKHTMLALTVAAALAGTSVAVVAQSGKNTGTMAPTTATSNQPDKSLAARGGMSSDKVKQIQSALDQKGHHVTVDGRWGKQTASALRDFQKQNGLKTTGKADPQTMQKLGLTSG